MTVSRRLRFEILKRDGYTCRYCGAKAPDVVLHVDHVVPISLGGGDEPNNLVSSCADCNAGKGSTAPSDDIVSDVDTTAILFAQAAERAATRRRAELGQLDGLLGDFDAVWRAYGDHWRPGDWTTSVETFMGHGLNETDLDRLIAATFAKGRSAYFRYFCGCCWREIGQRQELARRMIEDGEV